MTVIRLGEYARLESSGERVQVGTSQWLSVTEAREVAWWLEQLLYLAGQEGSSR